MRAHVVSREQTGADVVPYVPPRTVLRCQLGPPRLRLLDEARQPLAHHAATSAVFRARRRRFAEGAENVPSSSVSHASPRSMLHTLMTSALALRAAPLALRSASRGFRAGPVAMGTYATFKTCAARTPVPSLLPRLRCTP